MAQNTMENIELFMPELDKEEQEKYAEMFSEGLGSLKELLLFLWRNGINTYACCTGHKETINFGSLVMQAPKPYIFFDVETLTDTEFENLLIRLSVPANPLDLMRFDYQISKDRCTKDNKERTGLTIYYKHTTEENFTSLLTVMQRVKKNLTMRFDVIKDLLDNNKSTINRTNSKNVKEFIESAIRLKNISLTDYHNSSNELQYGRIILKYNNSMRLTYNVNDNLVKNHISFVDEQTGIIQVETLAVGYASKFKDGKYYTTTDGKDYKELTLAEAKALKPYHEDKKYNKWSEEFSSDEFNNILDEIEQTYVLED